jgi:hypothetical protein
MLKRDAQIETDPLSALDMDRKSVARFRKSLQVRHQELRIGEGKIQREMLTAQHDYGKDEGRSREQLSGKRNAPRTQISRWRS